MAASAGVIHTVAHGPAETLHPRGRRRRSAECARATFAILRVRRCLALRIHAHCVGGGARSAFSAENTVPNMRGTPYSHLSQCCEQTTASQAAIHLGAPLFGRTTLYHGGDQSPAGRVSSRCRILLHWGTVAEVGSQDAHPGARRPSNVRTKQPARTWHYTLHLLAVPKPSRGPLGSLPDAAQERSNGTCAQCMGM